MRQRLLITGANSFIGTALLERLAISNEYDIIATYRHNIHAMMKHPPKTISFQPCDLAIQEDINALFAQHSFDAVVHLAASIPKPGEDDFPSTADRDNISSTDNLLTAAKNVGCKRFVFASSIGVYDGLDGEVAPFQEDMELSPTSVYGQSKFVGESLLEAQCDQTMQGVSLRMPGVHGPGKTKGAVYAFLKAAMTDQSLNISEPKSVFRLLFIDDAIDTFCLALKADLPRPYTAYNIASKEILSLLDLAHQIIEITNSKSPCDVAVKATGRKQILNIEKIQNELNFSPKSLKAHLNSFHHFLKG